MNERVREIAKQAQVHHCVSHVRLEEFAALIVKECVEINKQELAFNAFESLANRYQEHFGVEQ